MKRISALVVFILSVSVANGAEKNNFKTNLKASESLIKAAGINEYEISGKIKINIGSGESKSTTSKTGYCENAAVVPLSAIAHPDLNEIHMVKAVVETQSHKKAKLLFTLKNEGGLTKVGNFFSVRLNLWEYNPGEPHIWVFFFTSNKVYANAAKIKCHVVR